LLGGLSPCSVQLRASAFFFSALALLALLLRFVEGTCACLLKRCVDFSWSP
jgi:hypothetical protein